MQPTIDIHNKALKISSKTVSNCDDLVQLKSWVNQINIEIEKMSLQISKAKSKVHIDGEYSDPGWFNRISSAKRLQGILKYQIQGRISMLKADYKKTSLVEKLNIERAFWHNQAKTFLHNDELEDCYLELDQKLKDLGFN